MSRSESPAQRILITGSARGIGLALARHYVKAGDEVLAVCREPGSELLELGCERIEHVELTHADGIERVRSAVGARSIDLVIHNAGLLRTDGLGSLAQHIEDLRAQFEVNTLAPLLLTEALLPQLGRGAKLAFVSSRVGSIGDNSTGGHYGYRMSKAALNIAGKSLSIELRDRGIAVALLHPGYVRTAMTGGTGEIEPAVAAAQLAQRIAALDLEHSGRFWHAKGMELPW